MALLSVAIGIVGVGFTAFSLVRLLTALRTGAPRDLVVGWIALMILGAAVTMLLLRS